jgi:hypothetical protein
MIALNRVSSNMRTPISGNENNIPEEPQALGCNYFIHRFSIKYRSYKGSN